MKYINNLAKPCYMYNGKFYMESQRKNFYMNDMFIDLRDCCTKMIESENDLMSVSYMAPELYVILEEVTVQN